MLSDKKLDVLYENTQEECLKLIKDDLPDNIKFVMEPLSVENENLCAKVNYNIALFFNKPENKLEYGLMVVKVIELVDEIKNLSGKDKYIISVRCIIEIIKETKSIPDNIKNDLILTISGYVESVILLTKGELLNKNIKVQNMIDTLYITKRSIDRIIEFIKNKNYNLQEILENVFIIVTQIMYTVGCYPALSGSQKKTIVIDVIQNIITKYKDSNGMRIPDSFIKMVLFSVPSIIDILVSVNEGIFNINVKKYFKCC